MHKERVKRVRMFLKQGYVPMELALELCDSIEMQISQLDTVYATMHDELKEKIKSRFQLLKTPPNDPSA
jgi:hypothetical protein